MIKNLEFMKTSTLTLLKIIFILFLLSQFFACRKHELIPQNTSSNELDDNIINNYSLKVQTAAFRGVYIDGFSTQIGNIVKEDSILNWCLKNNLNEISLYSINTILNMSNGSILLNSFINKAKNAPYYINVSFVAASLSTTTKEYTNYYLSQPNKFSAITTEYEFWNTGNSFTTFSGQLQYMNSINSSTSGAIKRQIYLSKFVDASGIITQDSTIAEQIVSSSDRIFLVNYSNNAYNLSSTTLNKIKIIANASHKLNKVTEIIILFNLNQNSVDPNIFSYFSINGSNHLFIDAYSKFKNDYNSANFTNKSFIKLNGFQLYNYTWAKNARP